MERPKNAWGDEIADPLDDDPWTVPEEERREVDDPTDPLANALDEETGDDLDGWMPDEDS